MNVERMLDYTLYVGDTALVVDSDPEVMVKVTAVLGDERVLAELLYGKDHGSQHGYERTQLRKRFDLSEVFNQLMANR